MKVTCGVPQNVTCGFPQGSVQGPKLFVLYINYMCKVFKVLKVVLRKMTQIYIVDGTNLYCSGEIWNSF